MPAAYAPGAAEAGRGAHGAGRLPRRAAGHRVRPRRPPRPIAPQAPPAPTIALDPSAPGPPAPPPRSPPAAPAADAARRRPWLLASGFSCARAGPCRPVAMKDERKGCGQSHLAPDSDPPSRALAVLPARVRTRAGPVPALEARPPTRDRRRHPLPPQYQLRREGGRCNEKPRSRGGGHWLRAFADALTTSSSPNRASRAQPAPAPAFAAR